MGPQARCSRAAVRRGVGLLLSMPDRFMPRIPRRLRYFEPDLVRCIACGEPLRRVHVLSGHYFATCDARLRRAGTEQRTVCGCHMHITASEGVCHVVELSRDEYQRLRQHVTQLTVRVVYAELGLLPVAS